MRTIEEFLTHYRRQRLWTRKIVAAAPEEAFDWSPAPDSFSCGDLVRHLIQAEAFWGRLIVKASQGEAWDPFPLPGEPGSERLEAFRRPNLESSHETRYGSSFAECLDSWSTVQARSEQALGAIPAEHLSRTAHHPLTGLEAPVWEFLLVMVEHEAHHRGQLSAYLKSLGVDQPADLWS